MLGGCFSGGSDGQKLLVADTKRFDLQHHGTSFGEGPRLVENNARDGAEALKGFTGAHQDAVFSGLAGSAHDRERCRDAYRAGITHHQHAQSGENGAFYIDVPGGQPGADEPGKDGKTGDQKNNRRVDAKHAVDQMKDARFQRAGVLDMADHLVEEAPLSDSGDRCKQRTCRIDRTADD